MGVTFANNASGRYKFQCGSGKPRLRENPTEKRKGFIRKEIKLATSYAEDKGSDIVREIRISPAW